MDTTSILDLHTASAGLLIARMVLGLLMAAHGAQKLVGWFGGYGLAGTAGFLEQIGFRPGRPFAAAAAVSETVGGLLVALGLFGPIGPALMVSVMVVAAVSVHWKGGLFATTNGIELPLLYAVGATALALTHFGLYSLDVALGLTSLWSAPLAYGAVALGILGGAANLALRRPAAVATAVPAAGEGAV